jgi:hypothetical protein
MIIFDNNLDSGTFDDAIQFQGNDTVSVMVNGVLFRAIDTLDSVCVVETCGTFLEIVPSKDTDNRVANVNQRGTVEYAVVHFGDKHEAAVVEIGVRDFGLGWKARKRKEHSVRGEGLSRNPDICRRTVLFAYKGEAKMSVNVHFNVCLDILNSIERILRLKAVHTSVRVVHLKLESLRDIIEPLLRHGINITGNGFGSHVDPSRTVIR